MADSLAAQLLLSNGFDIRAKDLDKETALRWAAEYGHLAAVQLLVEEKANIASKDELGFTAIHLAARYGHDSAVKYLLRKGAFVEEKNSKECTPLALAAEWGHVEVVRLLLDGKADITAKDKDGWAPLHFATLYGHEGIVSLLIEKGADIEEEDCDGCTPLLIAVKHRNLAMTCLLLDLNANVEAKDHDERTALASAAERGHKEVVQILVNLKADVMAKNMYGLPVLHSAARFNHSESVQFLLESGISTELKDDEGCTALALAAEWGQKRTVELLLDKGADITATDNRGWTALHYAARYDQTAVVRLLLDVGADIESKDNEGNTALALATEEGHHGVGQLLEGSEYADNYSETLLLSAAEHGRLEQVKQMLNKGVNVDSKDDDGWTALSLAAKNGNDVIVDLLLQKGAELDSKGQPVLWWAARYGHDRIVRLLLEKGFKTDSTDDCGQTPLSVAAQKGHETVVRLLLKKGADVNSEVSYGRTVLSFAAVEGHVTIAKLLVENGAILDSQFYMGKTALSLAREKNQGAILRLLLENGARKELGLGRDESEDSVKAYDGTTAVSVAKGKEDKVIASSLREQGIEETVENSEDSKNNSKPGDSLPALLCAAEKGYVTEVCRLLKLGTKVDFKDGNGREAMSLAAESGCDAVITLLLEKGAKVDAKDKDKVTALGWAVRSGHDSTVTLLLENGTELDSKDKDDRTPLWWAVLAGCESTARLLLQKGAAVDSKEKKTGRTALLAAASRGDGALVELLLENGAEVNYRDDSGQIPLTVAAQRGQRTTVELLLKKGANVNSTALDGKTALHFAAEEGHEAVVELLVEENATLDSKSYNERTPLSLAAEKGQGMAVMLLVEMGARDDLEDNNGRKALSFAKENGHEAVVKMLSRAALLRRKAKRKDTDPGSKSSRFYIYEPLRESSSIRLLELHPGNEDDFLSFDLQEVVRIVDAPPYEALSYEWKDKRSTIPIQCGGMWLRVAPNLKAALKRFRLRGSARVLWIDALCINQEDIQERNQQVAMMAKIYRNARSVLMWIGEGTPDSAAAFATLPILLDIWSILVSKAGSDSFSELEYVSSLHQVDNLKTPLLKIMDNQQAMDGLRELFHRPYFTRAWILQEAILAEKATVTCGQHQWDWDEFRNAMLALYKCESVLNMITNNRAFVRIFSMRQLFSNNGFLLLYYAVYGLLEFKASNPRDKIYAALGLGKRLPFMPDYNLTVQELYTSTARHLIKEYQNLRCWMHCNRPSSKEIPNLPSWVPDWTHPNLNTITSSEWKGDLIAGRPTASTTTLHVDGYVMDRIIYKTSITREKDLYDVIKAILQGLATLGWGVFDIYPGSKYMSEEMLNIDALWQTLIWTTRRNDVAEEAVPFLVWKLSADDTAQSLLRELPKDLEPRVQAWEDNSRKGEDFDLDIYKKMEGAVRYNVDLFYTEKGYFGITQLNEAEENIVIAIIGGVEVVTMLREKGQDHRSRWYEVVDEVFMFHLERPFKKLEEIEEGAVVERLEIR